ncbi:MAG: hypothetical protein JWQ13_3396 [Ramlibacter sp.]|jgi:hypothetical protein|nr:hypothetical protein [Ramlibacter sp.]
MSVDSLPDSVRRFILSSIPSVPYLEAVLLLRNEPATQWDAKRAAARLYLRPAVARELLLQLEAARIAAAAPQHEGCFWYRPEPGLAAMLDEVAAAYSTDLLRVTALIHSRIDKRAQQFADAFRWRKEP